MDPSTHPPAPLDPLASLSGRIATELRSAISGSEPSSGQGPGVDDDFESELALEELDQHLLCPDLRLLSGDIGFPLARPSN